GKDVWRLPLAELKRFLREIVPKRSASMVCSSHITGGGRDLFAEVCGTEGGKGVLPRLRHLGRLIGPFPPPSFSLAPSVLKLGRTAGDLPRNAAFLVGEARRLGFALPHLLAQAPVRRMPKLPVDRRRKTR